MLELLSDFTVRNVMLGAALIGLSSAVLGCFAVLRQQSLLGDTLSHAALPGICLGFLISGSRQLLPILAGALISGTLAALLVVLLSRRSRLKTDASLGIGLSVFFAVGTVLLSYIQNQRRASQAGLDAFLFGQAAAILPGDVRTIAVIALLVLLLVALFWKEFKVLSFDPGFAHSLGFPTLALEVLLSSLIALAVVIGLQMVGVILMVAMVIAPAAAARQWTGKLEHMVLLAAVFGVLAGVSGALLSALRRGLATGPVVVVLLSGIVLLSLVFAPERGLLWTWWQRRRNHAALREHKVLSDLYALAQQHNDPHYASEAGMLRSYYGFPSRRLLERLQRRGWVVAVHHLPQEGLHWRLTAAGWAEAEAMLAAMRSPTSLETMPRANALPAVPSLRQLPDSRRV